MKTIHLRITGMTCASCVLHIETDIKELDGVKEAVVNLPLKRGEVTFDPDKVDEKRILETVKKAGYKAVVEEAERRMHLVQRNRRRTTQTHARKWRAALPGYA